MAPPRTPEGPAEAGEGENMPLFMDVHHLDGGVCDSDVAGAHQKDVETQDAYGVNHQRCWVDERRGRICCLVDAPDAETGLRVHREARGRVADGIYEVTQGA